MCVPYALSTWLRRYDNGSGVDADVWTQYLYSVYWALTTLTTVGYGDITPTNNEERLYTLTVQCECRARYEMR